MKIVFLASSFTIIYYMRFHPTIKFTYDKQQDTFRILFVLGPTAVLALLIHQDWSIVEVKAISSVRPLDSIVHRSLNICLLTQQQSQQHFKL